MRSWWLIATAFVSLVACGSDGDPIVLPTTVTVVATADGTTGSDPVTTPTDRSRPTETSSTASTTPAPDDRAVLAFALAEQLADALAGEDWATARRLSPEPPFSDEIYAQSFLGLEESTLFLTYSKVIDDAVDLWLAHVDHEQRMTGPQTTLHCGHWRFDLDTSTLARVADRTVGTVPGFVEPASLESDGRRSCAGFDLVPGDRSDDTTPVDGSEPSVDDTEPGTVDDGWAEVTHEGRAYLCRAVGTGNDLDCVFDSLVGPPARIVGAPDLWCTDRGAGRPDCTTAGYYPSELDRFEERTVEGERVLCRDLECWVWPRTQVPSDATRGRADFVCDGRECRPAS